MTAILTEHEITTMVKALKHAEHRLNSLPHNYNDTDFRLISEGIKIGEENIKVMESIRTN